MRVTKGWSPAEQLEFAWVWETIRATYYQENGDESKAAQVRANIREVERKLNSAYYS